MLKNSIITILFFSVALAGCAQFDVDTSRTNPLDAVHDSGDLRLVLNKPVAKNGKVLLEWSNIFHKTESLSTDNFGVTGLTLFSSAGIPNATAIANIKNRTAHGLTTTALKTITIQSDSYAGEHDLTVFPGSVTTYFITGNFNLKKEDGSFESGIFYSNLAVYDPANP
ncbi:MAG: hypothetical protein KDK41_01985 [Leptospiraceae bacterium]|nr:hypothetical protein [Leptospiraceae bacterium]MCB1199388.1 hypothetical protein [Leptospiraceae bacterium]